MISNSVYPQVGFFVYHSYLLSSFQVDSITPHCSFLIYKPERREEVLIRRSQFLCDGRCGGSSPTSLSMSVLSTLLSTCLCNWLSASPWKWQNLAGKALPGVQHFQILHSYAGSCLSTRQELCLGLWVEPFPIHISVKLSSPYYTIVIHRGCKYSNSIITLIFTWQCWLVPLRESMHWLLHTLPLSFSTGRSPIITFLWLSLNPRRMDTSMKAEGRKERRCPFPWLRWSGDDAIEWGGHFWFKKLMLQTFLHIDSETV